MAEKHIPNTRPLWRPRSQNCVCIMAHGSIVAERVPEQHPLSTREGHKDERLEG